MKCALFACAVAFLPSPASGGDGITGRPLDSFPKSDRVWLGSFGAEVEVDPATELLPGRSGEIHWLVEDGTRVEDGQAVALMAYGQIRQSAAQLEIDEAKLPGRKRSAEWSNRDKKAGLRRQIEELHTRIAKLDLAPAERELVGEELAARLEVERGQMESQVSHLKDQLSPEVVDEELRLELAQLDQDIQRARLEHEELVRSMELIAEHDGVVGIDATGYVRVNEVIGFIRRLGHAVVAIQITDPDVRSEKPESLGLTVTGPDGRTFDGRYSHLIRGMGGRFTTATYYFDLDPDASGNPPPAEISGERMATIHKLLPERASIISKSPLLFSHPEQINLLGWAGFLREKWPEARVVYIGPQSIALTSDAP